VKPVSTLIDLAQTKAGSAAALCRALDVPTNHPCEWRNGKRAISPETVAALCDYLGMSGEEAREWIAIALIENPKNRSKADMLRRALFVSWAAGVVVLTTGQTDARAEQGYNSVTTTLYIVAHWLSKAARRALAAFSRKSWAWATSLQPSGP